MDHCTTWMGLKEGAFGGYHKTSVDKICWKRWWWRWGVRHILFGKGSFQVKHIGLLSDGSSFFVTSCGNPLELFGQKYRSWVGWTGTAGILHLIMQPFIIWILPSKTFMHPTPTGYLSNIFFKIIILPIFFCPSPSL